jgi:DNA-binding MarR family transcriptional regulator
MAGRDDEAARPMSDGAMTDQEYGDLADFRHGLRVFLRFSEEQARQAGITPQQHLLLLAIRGHASYPDVTIGDIAERLQVRHHSASRLVERGVRRGLLERREDQADRRRVLVSLTEEGRCLLEQISRANRRELSSLESSLFRESLRQALESVRAGLGAS